MAAPACATHATFSGGKRQPSWVMPSPSGSAGELFEAACPLRVLNSLTRTKVPFIPMNGREVFWYACGPTVYASSHMGHARTYVCFDVLRRIMRDHFGYRVTLIMNITDIDDKIIARANEAGRPFNELAAEFEHEFLEDMARLGVEPADEMPRVSEHVPEVVDFVERLIAKGFAYESKGSVYFDVASYSAKHPYGKLRPENVGDEASALEGEGALGAAVTELAKKGACDFALWKAAKEGEPSWPSPWGEGRPGWHIECSVMASEALKRYGTGGVMDIHSGGVDLQFPHHDNEIAQSEACLGCKQWVGYFLHSGHLNIRGQKMGKSLKNFTTIRQALERYPARHLRLLFLSFRYNSPLNYSPEMMDEVASKDRAITSVIQNAERALRILPKGNPTKVGPGASALNASAIAARAAVDAALADDFDTPTAMNAVLALIADINAYIDSPSAFAAKAATDGAAAGSAAAAATAAAAPGASSEEEPVNGPALRRAAAVVSRVLRLFGLIDAELATSVGPVSASAAGAGAASGAGGDVTAPFIDALAEFRQRVREAARTGDKAAIMAACDWVRDDRMAALGVKLEDTSSDATQTWKRTDPAELLAEVERRRAAADEAAERAAASAEAAAAAAAAADAILAIPDERLFMDAPQFAGQFSAFGDDGMPTADAAGAPIAKSQAKKLAKALKAHGSKRAKWLAKQ
ncbi:hypothetical protein FNF27_04587 [Cafeteria roenbergensis]|uniref:cysteine--tRNA ligase n=1 Tax=Cafeteria roenbergensis TaxID=33653 RepID=A0A5A8E9T3_CAFRO|nr:hypothetical protein FNF27_04587 [Cafeteria roenbergensis]